MSAHGQREAGEAEDAKALALAEALAWFATPLGRYLLAREQALFDAAVADVFGFNAVQLGLVEHDLLRACRIPQCLTVGYGERARVRAHLHELPLATQSIDLVLLPHALEFSPDPHQVLREVERVLIPEGHLLLTGFNPLSLWGAMRMVRGRQGFPWKGSFISLARIKDWLALLNFEVSGGRMTCYVPPCGESRWLERFRFMERAGDRWWPLMGGVYFLVARKRVPGMRLILPAWQQRRAAGELLAGAAQRRAASKVAGKECVSVE